MIRAAASRDGAEQHVGRLDVTVHQPDGMGRVERGRDLGDDAGDARRVQRAEPPEEGPHVSPADIPHGDEQDSAGLAGLEDGDDMRVVNGGGGPRLADEPLAERPVAGNLGGQDLQRDPSVQPDVERAVDDGHAAPADLLIQPVAGDLRADPDVAERGREFVGHRAPPAFACPSGAPLSLPQRRHPGIRITRFTGKLRDSTPVFALPATSCQPAHQARPRYPRPLAAEWRTARPDRDGARAGDSRHRLGRPGRPAFPGPGGRLPGKNRCHADIEGWPYEASKSGGRHARHGGRKPTRRGGHPAVAA